MSTSQETPLIGITNQTITKHVPEQTYGLVFPQAFWRYIMRKTDGKWVSPELIIQCALDGHFTVSTSPSSTPLIRIPLHVTEEQYRLTNTADKISKDNLHPVIVKAFANLVEESKITGSKPEFMNLGTVPTEVTEKKLNFFISQTVWDFINNMSDYRIVGHGCRLYCTLDHIPDIDCDLWMYIPRHLIGKIIDMSSSYSGYSIASRKRFADNIGKFTKLFAEIATEYRKSSHTEPIDFTGMNTF